MKGDLVNGYLLTTDWKVVGGMSEIAFASKGGEEWFIKKFISPKYPTSDSPGSERVKEQKRRNCEEFEARQRELNERIGSKVSKGGNLVYAVDFFRVDTLYYKINEKIDASSIPICEICRLNNMDVMIILKSLVHSLRIMHRENIVHGDLKPDNILIKATATGAYTTKLIDFDDSFFSGLPPEDREQVVGTPEYYSPELFNYITDEDGEISGSTLTTKSDIFALGVIFCEYLTGSKPIIPEGYDGTYSAVLDGKIISYRESTHLTSTLQNLLNSMLQLDAAKRPSIDEVFDVLKCKCSPPEPPILTSGGITTTTTVRIVRFVANPDKAKRGDAISIEWDVENAKQIRIDGGFPVVKRGKKMFPAKDTFILSAISEDGETVEKEISISITESDIPEPISPDTGGSRLRGKGLDVVKRK